MNVFDEIQHRLSSKTRIRSLFKDVHVDDMDRIVNRMNEVLAEKLEARKQVEEERKAKQDSVEAIKQIMAEKGVSMDDLDGLELAVTKRKRNVQKFTFEYETEAGDTVQWNGSTTGRLPRDFQAYLERSGKKRLECVVDEGE